jgi:hypothetical protein
MNPDEPCNPDGWMPYCDDELATYRDETDPDGLAD